MSEMSETYKERWGAWLALLDEDSNLALDLAARVNRGATILDRVEPGWPDRIDGDRLADESCDVLGQVFGSFSAGAQAIADRLPDGEVVFAVASGFKLMREDRSPGRFAALANVWWKHARDRLAGRALGFRENLEIAP